MASDNNNNEQRKDLAVAHSVTVSGVLGAGVTGQDGVIQVDLEEGSKISVQDVANATYRLDALRP